MYIAKESRGGKIVVAALPVIKYLIALVNW